MQTSFQKRLGGLPNNAGSAHLHVNAQHKRKSETIALSSTVDPLIRVRFRRLVGQIRTVMGSKVVRFFLVERLSSTERKFCARPRAFQKGVETIEPHGQFTSVSR